MGVRDRSRNWDLGKPARRLCLLLLLSSLFSTTVSTASVRPPLSTAAQKDEPGECDAPPTDAPPTEAPPTDAPPTEAPPTEAPPTDAPPTEAPPSPTAMPTTDPPPTDPPPTDAPPTSEPPPTQGPPPPPPPKVLRTHGVEGCGVVTTQAVRERHTRDLKWVGYIESSYYDSARCRKNLVTGLYPRFLPHVAKLARLTCLLFRFTANPVPKKTFTASSWAKFKRSKQYRSYVRIPRIDYSCQARRIIEVEGDDVGDGNFKKPRIEHNEGYSPTFKIRRFKGVPFAITTGGGFVGAEKYKQRAALGFNRSTAKFRLSRDREVLTVTYLQASRLSRALRILQMPLTLHDAPFIWTFVHERLTCRGAGVKITSSSIPTRVLYLDNEFVTETFQSQDLARFIRQGSRLPRKSGHGPLDGKCHRELRIMWGKVQFDRNRSCLKEIPGW